MLRGSAQGGLRVRSWDAACHERDEIERAERWIEPFGAGTELARVGSVPSHLAVLRSLAVVIACSPFVGLAHAEERSLSLRDAVALAIRHNPALAAAGAGVAAAQASVLAARGLDDLVLSASADYRITRRQESLDVPERERAIDSIEGSLQLTRPLPIGGRLSLGFQTGYLRTEVDRDNTLLGQREILGDHAPALQLSLEQPLLRGFGVNVARAERRRASLGRDLASAQRDGLAAALVRDVVSGYWALVHSRRELAIRRASAAAARDQLERVRANIDVGKLPPSASAEIEVAIALRENAVLSAEQTVTERELELGRLCAVPVSDRLTTIEPLPELDPTERGSPEILEGLLEATLAAALAQNPQLQALRTQGRVGAAQLEVTENGLLPQLDLSISGGPLGSAPDAGAAYAELVSFGGYTVAAQLGFAFPIAGHAARGARDLARQRLHETRLDEADIAAQIGVAAARAVAVLETSRRRAAVLVPSLQAAALDLEAEKARFEVGRASNFDVLRRQDALAAVQLLLLGAQLDRLQAAASLDALTGRIFEQNGVELRGADR
jgi:outer membrane protein